MPEDIEQSGIIFAPESTTTRVHTVSTKLNAHELEQFNSLAEKRGVSSGELLRLLFREELGRADLPLRASPELVEIVGLRGLLLTLMKPLLSGQKQEADYVDKVHTKVKEAKRGIAAAIAAGEQD